MRPLVGLTTTESWYCCGSDPLFLVYHQGGTTMSFEEVLGTLIGWTLALVGPPLLIVWVLIFISGFVIAADKCRVSFGYVVSLLLFGPFAILVMLALRPNEYRLAERAVRKGFKKWCPFCHNDIPAKAIRCHCCGVQLSPLQNSALSADLLHHDESLTPRSRLKLQMGSGPSIVDANHVILRHANGESLTSISHDTDVPYSTISEWVDRYMEDDEWMHRVNKAIPNSVPDNRKLDEYIEKRDRARRAGFTYYDKEMESRIPS